MKTEYVIGGVKIMFPIQSLGLESRWISATPLYSMNDKLKSIDPD